MIDDERVSLHLPEQVEVSYELAGLGSRFLAAALDAAIFILILLLVSLATLLIRTQLTGDVAVSALVAWIVFGAWILIGVTYHVYYEVAREGKTPGKRLTGLRVIAIDGASVTFDQSAVRNIIRIVDWLPVLYGVGVVSLFASSKNQRLGDMAAGTMVVKERLEEGPEDAPAPRPTPPVTHRPLPREVSEDLLGTIRAGVRTVTREEERTIRRFLDRRYDLGPDVRRRLAGRLADALRQRFPGLDPGRLPNSEAFLEVVIRAIDEQR